MNLLEDGSVVSFFQWWLTVFVVGLLAWPLCFRFFDASADRGFMASKVVGLFIATYAAWIVSALGLLPFAKYGVPIGVAVLVAVFALFFRHASVLTWRFLFPREAGFFALLCLGAVIRLTSPEIYGLEKFMDFGFQNAAMLASTMPPPDPWFGGQPINYYYFGHVSAAWLTLASSVPADHGYNLMMATLFAMTGSLVFVIVNDCLVHTGPRTARTLAALATFCVMLGGNFHTVLYSVFRPWMKSETGRPDFYYPDSTRFVGFDPPTEDKGFTEMPAYGFAVGDMHAHVLNLPVSMLIGLVVLNLVLRQTPAESTSGLRIRMVDIAMLAFLLAICVMANSWDAIISGTLVAVAGLLAWMGFGRHALRWLPKLVCQGLAVVAAALLLALPFLLNFTPFGSELRWAEHTTPLWQLLALYGHILPGCLAAFILAVWGPRGSAPALFACILALMAALLIVLPEIAYVKDIYGSDFARANTMFKLTFRAQPLGVMAAIVASGILLSRWEGTRLTFVPYLLLVPLLLTLTYPSHWLWPRLVDTPFDKYTLDGLGYVTREAPDDMAFFPLIRRLRLNEGETILEADGDSYSYAGRFSAMTGRPTALGWHNHEWLWRGNYDAVSSKSALVEGVYQSRSPLELCKALKSLHVAYVVVGDFERKRYARLNIQPLLDVADLTAKAGATSLYQIRGGACGDS